MLLSIIRNRSLKKMTNFTSYVNVFVNTMQYRILNATGTVGRMTKLCY